MICALSHYPLDLSGGGSVRSFNIWKIIAEIYNDFVISYALADDSEQIHLDRIVEKHIQKPFLFRKMPGGYLCAFPSLIERQLSTAKIFENTPSVVILEGPYMGYAVLKAIGIPEESKIIYDAQNVEVKYHEHYFNWNPLKKALLSKIGSIEKYVMDRSDYVLATSKEESKVLEERYRQSPGKIIIVPNGVDTDVLKPLGTNQKLSLKSRSYIKTPIVLFIGSKIEANIVAGRWILEDLAKKMPQVTFLIVGNVCDELQREPNNVKLLGRLPDTEKNELLRAADVAINPVQFGAGTNVKMLEYLAAGVPIVSTKTGMRGLDLKDGKEVLMSNLRDFHVRISEILDSESLAILLSQNSSVRAQDYNWKNIALSVKARLTSLNSDT